MSTVHQVLKGLLNRPTEANKYTFGHVLVVGGSPGMVGAPLLAAMAALRAGAGLVTIACSQAVANKLDRRVKEVMTLGLPDDSVVAAKAVKCFVVERKVNVIVVGPGLRADDINLAQLLKELNLPVVLDAGALAALQSNPDILKSASKINKNIILTPHGGEFKRLIGHDLPPSRKELKAVAADFVQKYQITLVLKGKHTLVVHPDRKIYENTTGNPGLATAGTGDVLAGMISGILAQGVEASQAAEAAVYLHGLAGDLAAKAKTQPGMIASDVIDYLPAAFKSLLA